MQLLPRFKLEIPESVQDPVFKPDLLDEEIFTNESSLSHSLVGRKKNLFTLILEQFFTRYSRNPKKEFFNTFAIRSIKRFFRCAAVGKQPTRTCIGISEGNAVQEKCWKKIQKMYKKNKDYYDDISLTENSPLTDCKTKRVLKDLKKVPKSYNNGFCARFFSDLRMQKAFFVLMDFLFSSSDMNELCKRFGFKCCEYDLHYDLCFEKWSKLKDYFYSKYFYELDLKVSQKALKYIEKSTPLKLNVFGNGLDFSLEVELEEMDRLY